MPTGAIRIVATGRVLLRLGCRIDGLADPRLGQYHPNSKMLFTRMGAMIGTPEYMIPEQALSSGEGIDARTDVYSIGIFLYELAAGTPPLDLRIALDELLPRLRDEEPAKPNTEIRTQDQATSNKLAEQHGRAGGIRSSVFAKDSALATLASEARVFLA
jgi:serine/threonine protein kinase